MSYIKTYFFTDVKICRLTGDPHYKTFDKQMIHFQGMCTYDLASPIMYYPGLEYFNVYTRNERRYGKTTVAYLRYIEVKVYGIVIRIERHKVITVNMNQYLNYLSQIYIFQRYIH